jgi:hypothetical protein
VVVAGDPAHRGGRAVVLLVFSLAFLALAALTGQPKGPAKILVISKEWSSDRRRAVPLLARPAEAGGLEFRISLSMVNTESVPPKPPLEQGQQQEEILERRSVCPAPPRAPTQHPPLGLSRPDPTPLTQISPGI